MKHWLGAGIFVGVAAVALIAGAAFACTATSSITVVPELSPAGRQVQLSGATFAPGRVEIRWNSVDGPVLGQVAADEFQKAPVSVTIPSDAKPGVYYLVAVGPSTVARSAIEVTAAAGSGSVAGVQSGLWRGFDQPSMGLPSGPAVSSGSENPMLPVGVALSVFALASIVFGAAAGVKRRVKA